MTNFLAGAVLLCISAFAVALLKRRRDAARINAHDILFGVVPTNQLEILFTPDGLRRISEFFDNPGDSDLFEDAAMRVSDPVMKGLCLLASRSYRKYEIERGDLSVSGVKVRQTESAQQAFRLFLTQYLRGYVWLRRTEDDESFSFQHLQEIYGFLPRYRRLNAEHLFAIGSDIIDVEYATRLVDAMIACIEPEQIMNRQSSRAAEDPLRKAAEDLAFALSLATTDQESGRRKMVLSGSDAKDAIVGPLMTYLLLRYEEVLSGL